MIYTKTKDQIELMRIAGSITAEALELVIAYARPGISTKALDKIAHDYIISRGAKPSFLHYGGFPGTICASVDDVVVHGFPSDKPLEEGQILSIDCGAIYKGWQGDAARTIAIGKISPEKQKLIDVTKESFFEGIKGLKEGSRLGDIGSRVQTYAEKFGFGVVRDFVGHGIGRQMHEDPSVPNYGMAGTGMKLKAGHTIAIEPMITMGSPEVRINGWDHRTRDGLPSAHYENTVLITETGCEILTQISPEGREKLKQRLEAE